ncbi:hypothetical protein [Desulfococcus sp.]|uniref:hypothetical protein n=1 Tax=Desulfococcus sp. TaxID=2025834 RepID=UPI003593A0EF
MGTKSVRDAALMAIKDAYGLLNEISRQETWNEKSREYSRRPPEVIFSEAAGVDGLERIKQAGTSH